MTRAFVVLRPGVSRFNLPYFENDETIDFILDAIELVAQHGWRILPQVRTRSLLRSYVPLLWKLTS